VKPNLSGVIRRLEKIKEFYDLPVHYRHNRWKRDSPANA
jgi:hypothetical protein